ncbi:hypothetical protein D3C77_316430 [compost metagenome]
MGVVGVGHGRAGTGRRVYRAIAPGEVAGRGFSIAVGQRGLELTAILQGVIDLEETFPDVLVQLVPLGIDEGRAADIQQLAIGIRRQAKGRGGMVVLVGAAQGQRGVRGHVVFQTAVNHRPFVLGIVDKGLVVFIGGDKASAQATVAVQRTGDVHGRVIVVVGAGRQLATEGKLAQGTLAYQVDGATRLARALVQAGRSAQHLDPVEHRQVEAGHQVALASHLRNPVNLYLVDKESAHVDIVQA